MIELMYCVGDSKNLEKDAEGYSSATMRRFDVSHWEAVFVDAGIFTSKSDARRNGFSGEIPYGYHFWVVGKLKNEIEVLRWDAKYDHDQKCNERMDSLSEDDMKDKSVPQCICSRQEPPQLPCRCTWHR